MIVYISILWLALSIFLQMFLFNQLHLMGGVVLIYLYFLIKLPVEIKVPVQILLGFLTGLLIDIFSNTIGMHALVCTFMMWVRIPIFHLFVLAEDFKAGSPNMTKMGIGEFIKFVIIIVLLHSILLYTVESFSLFNIIPLVLKIFVTTLLTSAFTIGIEFATKKKIS